MNGKGNSRQDLNQSDAKVKINGDSITRVFTRKLYVYYLDSIWLLRYPPSFLSCDCCVAVGAIDYLYTLSEMVELIIRRWFYKSPLSENFDLK